ncbi:N-methyl-D-aspartate receptor NMDAR2C subunit [Candidatus Woesebacteria bacterium]|nr:N-methyl-D-aspartate receptor NMDAR2C subunit [Candidatus Woesebacteria bacterium]
MKEKDQILENLNTRWLNLWGRLGAFGEIKEAFTLLTTRYKEPHRFYHTLKHVEDCLNKFDEVKDFVVDKEALELAIWYHDAVYVPGAKDNEEQSANLAIKDIKSMSLPDELGLRVAKLIMVTKHSTIPSDFDAEVLVDIDLSILGEKEEKFDGYEKQIRKEYAVVPDKGFREGRLRLLKSFLDRKNLYTTQFFYQKYEVVARQNIARSILNLNGKDS